MIYVTNNFFFWKTKKITRFGITKIWGIFLQLKFILSLYKYFIFNFNIKDNYIYCYIYNNNFFINYKNVFAKKIKKNTFKIKIIKNLLYLNYQLIWIWIFSKIIKKKFIFIFNYFVFKSFIQFKIKFKFFNTHFIYKYKKIWKQNKKKKVKKLWILKLELKNLFIYIQYYLKTKKLYDFNIKLKHIQDNNFFNLKWINHKILLQKIIKQSNFKIDVILLLIIFHLSEKFKQSFILLESIIWLFTKTKILKKKKFSLKTIKRIEILFYFLRTSKIIFFKGFTIRLAGKLKKHSMRKSKYTFSNGIASNTIIYNMIESSSFLIARAGIIHLKISIFF